MFPRSPCVRKLRLQGVCRDAMKEMPAEATLNCTGGHHETIN